MPSNLRPSEEESQSGRANKVTLLSPLSRIPGWGWNQSEFPHSFKNTNDPARHYLSKASDLDCSLPRPWLMRMVVVLTLRVPLVEGRGSRSLCQLHRQTAIPSNRRGSQSTLWRAYRRCKVAVPTIARSPC